MPIRKIKKIVDQSFENIPTKEEKPVKKEKFLKMGKWKIKTKTFFLASAGAIGLLIILAVLSQTILKPASPEEATTPPAPTPTPFEEKIASPSAYATDSAILRIESELESIEKELQETDLKEASLNPPVLDMDINFKE
jgi:hypothetical protein